jgi:LPS O-antigen subunit length determinant protein (WzzB/FepE family)
LKPWIQLASRLYPSAWRKRYGTEFHALLEDVNPGWRELIDVFTGALKMQLTTGATYWKLGAAFALAGLLVATVASFVIPREYTSTAVLRLSDDKDLLKVEGQVLSRTSLSDIVRDPALDLYPSERTRQPLEDVIEYMRTRAIHIGLAQTKEHAAAITISYRYPDRRKAQAVVRALISRFVETYVAADIHTHQNIEVVDSASLPVLASSPKRPEMLITGLLGGLFLGLIAAAFIQHPRRALVVATVGIAGALLGGSLSLLLPNRYISTAVLHVDTYDQDLQQAVSRAQRPNLAFHVANLSGSRGTAIEITYLDTDPKQAQAMVRSVATSLIAESKLRRQNVEYVDIASYPMSPSSPNRYMISTLGGLLVGLIALLLQHRRAIA